MYLEHYGLSEAPFSITPDPRFVFLSERHRDALAHLLYGVGQGGSGGFVQLTGEVGTGKTTLSRLLLEQIPENTRVALVLNPRLSAIELLETVCEELHLDIAGKRGSAKALIDALNAYLLDAYAKGLRVVVVIDEAQNLPVDALEQVRLLTNLETDKQKLLQIVLLGQPELREMLAREDLRQLAQRITARFHLTPLDAAETAEYLRHRYRVAGGQHFPFSSGAVRRIHARSGGVPRLINVIAERALLAGYARDAATLDEQFVDLAANEALPAKPAAARLSLAWIPAVALAIAALLALVAWWRPAPEVASAAPAAKPAPAKATPPARVEPVPSVDAAGLATRLQAEAPSPLPAWQRLLALWRQPASSVTVGETGLCTAVATGVRCSAGRAPLDRLLALDRPVLLPLLANDGQRWAVLLGADARRVRLGLAGGVVDVDRTVMASVWDGRYFALWLAPPELPASLAPGARGPGIAWLRERLGQPAAPDQRYDWPLANIVQQFQQARGLPADGVAGAETLMALAGDGSGPRLQRELR